MSKQINKTVISKLRSRRVTFNTEPNTVRAGKPEPDFNRVGGINPGSWLAAPVCGAK